MLQVFIFVIVALVATIVFSPSQKQISREMEDEWRDDNRKDFQLALNHKVNIENRNIDWLIDPGESEYLWNTMAVYLGCWLDKDYRKIPVIWTDEQGDLDYKMLHESPCAQKYLDLCPAWKESPHKIVERFIETGGTPGLWNFLSSVNSRFLDRLNLRYEELGGSLVDATVEEPDGEASITDITNEGASGANGGRIKDVEQVKAAATDGVGWVLKVVSIIGIYFIIKYALSNIGFGFLW